MKSTIKYRYVSYKDNDHENKVQKQQEDSTSLQLLKNKIYY